MATPAGTMTCKGPLLLEQCAAKGAAGELLSDFQLQVEHALDHFDGLPLLSVFCEESLRLG
jgi:hypothetical protein